MAGEDWLKQCVYDSITWIEYIACYNEAYKHLMMRLRSTRKQGSLWTTLPPVNSWPTSCLVMCDYMDYVRNDWNLNSSRKNNWIGDCKTWVSRQGGGGRGGSERWKVGGRGGSGRWKVGRGRGGSGRWECKDTTILNVLKCIFLHRVL